MFGAILKVFFRFFGLFSCDEKRGSSCSAEPFFSFLVCFGRLGVRAIEHSLIFRTGKTGTDNLPVYVRLKKRICTFG